MKYRLNIDYKRYPWGKEYHERVLYHNKPQTSSAQNLADVILASPVVFGGKRGVLRYTKEGLGNFRPVEYCSDSEFRKTFDIPKDGKLTLKAPEISANNRDPAPYKKAIKDCDQRNTK